MLSTAQSLERTSFESEAAAAATEAVIAKLVLAKNTIRLACHINSRHFVASAHVSSTTQIPASQDSLTSSISRCGCRRASACLLLYVFTRIDAATEGIYLSQVCTTEV